LPFGIFPLRPLRLILSIPADIKKPRKPKASSFGSTAVFFSRPVAFRPLLTKGLAFIWNVLIYREYTPRREHFPLKFAGMNSNGVAD
jgi:hypothetical protein